MPEYLTALIYLMLLSAAFFVYANKPVAAIIGQVHFAQRRNLWLGLTLAAFLAPNFWFWALIAIPFLLYAKRQESNAPALFFFILFALPFGYIEVPAWGLLNYFFNLSYQRMLSLFILLPAFLSLIRQAETLPFGRIGSDRILAAFLLLTAILYLRGTTGTDALRQTFYLFTDVFLPYFVISRSLKNMQTFKDAMLSLVIAIMLLALIAIMESLKNWLVFRLVIRVFELQASLSGYLGREGMLRVSASVGHPLALGYLMMVGTGFYLFLQGSFQSKFVRRSGVVLLAAGLIAPLSRGPWMAVCLLFIIFIATGRNSARRLMGSALAVIFALLLISVLPGGERVINLLPFIGTTETDNIEFRQRLITNSIIVIQRNPWLGSVNFLEEPEMLAMYEGGTIDVVNTYIGVTLAKGFIGLGLFVGFFILVLTGIKRAMNTIADRDSEEYLLGRVLLATLLAILFLIFTTSSISVIPLVYYSVAGLGVAYAQMVRIQSERMP